MSLWTCLLAGRNFQNIGAHSFFSGKAYSLLRTKKTPSTYPVVGESNESFSQGVIVINQINDIINIQCQNLNSLEKNIFDGITFQRVISLLHIHYNP